MDRRRAAARTRWWRSPSPRPSRSSSAGRGRATAQGVAPLVVQGVGYVFAAAGGAWTCSPARATRPAPTGSWAASILAARRRAGRSTWTCSRSRRRRDIGAGLRAPGLPRGDRGRRRAAARPRRWRRGAGGLTDLDRLLDFAARSRLPEGGFGYLGDDGRVLPDRPVETWIVARMTHVFGLAHLLGRPGRGRTGPARGRRAHRRAAARRRARRLAGEHGRRHEGGLRARLRAPRRLDRRRPPACRAAGALLDEALAVWQRPVLGRRRGHGRRGVGPRLDDGSTTTAASTPTCTASRRCWPPPTRWPPPTPAGRPSCAARRCGPPSAWSRLGAGGATGGCPSTSPPTGSRCPTTTATGPADPFRPYGVTVGHQFEWARLALHVRAVTADPPAWLLDDAVAPVRRRGDARLGRRRRRRLPVHARLGRPAGRRRPHALGALRGDRRRDGARRRSPATPRYRELADRLAGARRGGRSPTRPPAAGTTSSRRRRGRHRHLGRAARRLPPGADAAARRPPGPGQRRRRAALTCSSRCSTASAPGRVGATIPPRTRRVARGQRAGVRRRRRPDPGRLRPVDAVRVVPPVHGRRRAHHAARRHAHPLGDRRSTA